MNFLLKSWSSPRGQILRVALIIGAILWIYAPVFRGDWMWDDDILITGNQLVHDPAGWWKIWFEPGRMVDYQPVTVSVVWIEWHLWRNNTLGYHLVSVVLHMVSSLLVWRLLDKLGVRLAWLGGLLFAVHPVMVESVAWIAELKNTLSLPPFLLALCAWIDYDRERHPRDFWRSLVWFLIAALCKGTTVMFPVVLLLYAWWKRARVNRDDIRSSAPFFVISLCIGVLTLLYLQFDDSRASPLPGWLARPALAGSILGFYLQQFILPVGLMPVYPKWGITDLPVWAGFCWLALAGMIFWFCNVRTGWGRHLLLGLGFFLINLAPFAGFTAGTYMEFTWAMDHILYLPSIGLVGLAAAMAGKLESNSAIRLRLVMVGLLMVVMGALACGSREYARIYAKPKTLWAYALEKNPYAYIAHINLGIALLTEGRNAEALVQFREALRLKPDYAKARDNAGSALLQQGETAVAIEEFRAAIRIDPTYYIARNNLGNAYLKSGDRARAIDEYRAALAIQPDYTLARNNLGNSLLETGARVEAIGEYRRALEVNPEFREARYNLARALIDAGAPAEAVAELRVLLGTYPNYPEAHFLLGNTLLRMGAMAEAVKEYRQAIQLRPDYLEALCNLGTALQMCGDWAGAAESYQKAVKLDPNNFEARYGMGNVDLHDGRWDLAILQYREAVRLRPDSFEAHNNLGGALGFGGDFSEAAKEFGEAVRLRPGDAAARENLTKARGAEKAKIPKRP